MQKQANTNQIYSKKLNPQIDAAELDDQPDLFAKGEGQNKHQIFAKQINLFEYFY